MTDTSQELSGGGWGDVCSNDPGEREGTKPAPNVPAEGFYHEHWTNSSAGDAKLENDN